MNRNLRKTGVLALCTGVPVYLYHRRQSRLRVLALQIEDAQSLSTELCPPGQKSGRALVPECKARDGPLVLQLRQVQVLFRHGARTPLHTTSNLSEKSYDSDMLMRGHQESMFPYIRASPCGTRIKYWSKLENKHMERLLLGGSFCGQLTSYGREQVYTLGLSLGDTYRERLDLYTYDPDQVRVMSTNLRRTVQSAAGVLAGFFGKDHLVDYAQYFGPLKIFLPDPCYNILAPNTETCCVLKKTQTATLDPDSIPSYKDKRLEIEEHIMKRRDSIMEVISEVQTKIDNMMEFYEKEGAQKRTQEMNQHGDHYVHDPIFQPLYDERAEAIQGLDRFWANVMNREPSLQEIITEGDMRALVYLRNIRVEQFQGTITSGYRIHFYFDKNPYFHNNHLCKEVFINKNCSILSKQTTIQWKDGVRHLVQPQFSASDKAKRNVYKCTTPQQKSSPPMSENGSFFAWFSTPTHCDSDVVGSAIAGDIWKNPLAVMENELKVPDPWDNPFNFVYCLDDATSRMAHGWWYPSQLMGYRKMIEKHATDIIFYSLSSQNDRARKTVTRLSAGPLLTELVDTARRHICGEKAPKLTLYSTHDSILVAMLIALQLWNDYWPKFASDLRLELYKDINGADYYVRLLYNGKEVRMRGQSESYMLWTDFYRCVKGYTINREEYGRICSSDILERCSQESGKLCEKKENPNQGSGVPCKAKRSQLKQI